MPLLARSVPTPLVVDVRPGALADLPGILADGRLATTGKVAAVVGSGMGDEIGPVIGEALPGIPVHTVASGSLDAARSLADVLRPTGFDALVGIGGGGTLDVGKYAAAIAGIPFVAVATTLTHDGLASPVAVLERDGRTGSYGVHPPIAVVVDLDRVARGPLRHIASGIGDAVSNLSALRDWELARQVHGEAVDGLAAGLARTAGESVLHHPAPTSSTEFLESLAHSLISSGLAMTVAGSSRPCSGAEHEISHAINALFPGDRLHGETVAVGTLFVAVLRDDPLLAAMNRCFRERGVPRLPEDVGLDDAQFTAAVIEAPSTRPGRFTILEHLDLDERAVTAAISRFREAVG